VDAARQPVWWKDNESARHMVQLRRYRDLRSGVARAEHAPSWVNARPPSA
jgi:hypothetical protein